ncbi:hypothetical protein FRUB_02309 [Fimbriiglobus ruber]|uniref:Uncharacterized protein n=2 Tax=Fimbriiglobus ruber TaxID=1908690 RepID=A0A225E7G6_9BACT|nr:hypothetical protein FRUB_02309 [Fimbriiglobus ruber]
MDLDTFNDLFGYTQMAFEYMAYVGVEPANEAEFVQWWSMFFDVYSAELFGEEYQSAGVWWWTGFWSSWVEELGSF